MKKITLALLTCGIFLTSFNLFASSEKESAPTLIETLHAQTLNPSSSFQKLSFKPETFSHIWDSLLENGVLEVSATEQEIRPYFVTFQAMIEKALVVELGKEVLSVRGFIHTPMPATPLCTRKLPNKPSLVRPIEVKPSQARTNILKKYLLKGGDLYIVYPKEGLFKRTPHEQKTYAQRLEKHPNHLIDLPLSCEEIPEDLIGATYIFKDRNLNEFVFSIQMTQFNSAQESSHFALWLGPLTDARIEKRATEVLSFIKENAISPEKLDF